MLPRDLTSRFHLAIALEGKLTCRKYDVIALLTNVAKSAVKEKVTRVILATLRVGFSSKSHSSTYASYCVSFFQKQCTDKLGRMTSTRQR
ncbi:MAG: hypothetical protein EOO85_10270 [Pedobacter sp.]|nr:MAG: hypothetical protein EOO85_10270 [Pedobacter sp.]